MRYKYHLRKSSQKEVCPQCGQKRFVPFVDENENIVGWQFGRCDREQSCGYFRYPNYSNHYDTKPCDDIDKIEESPLEWKVMARTFGDSAISTTLYNYALSAVHEDARSRLPLFFEAYRVRYFQPYTIFPQFDIDGNLRSAKMIQYADNGHRIHGDYCQTWLHKFPLANNLHNKGKLNQCLFGEHLLNPKVYKKLYNKQLTADTPIFIVESEKTAILMAVESRAEGLWLACGGSQMLKNKDRLKVLQGRNVTLIPDNGQFWNWKTTADKNGWKIVSSIEHFDWQGIPNVPKVEGCDVWDIVEFLIKYKRQ